MESVQQYIIYSTLKKYILECSCALDFSKLKEAVYALIDIGDCSIPRVASSRRYVLLWSFATLPKYVREGDSDLVNLADNLLFMAQNNAQFAEILELFIGRPIARHAAGQ